MWQAQEAAAKQVRQARRAQECEPAPAHAGGQRGDAAPDAATLMRWFSGSAEEKTGRAE